MSESTIPFQGQTAVMDRPAPGLEPEPADGGGNRTLLLALGGVAALLVVALVAYMLVFAGGDAAVEEGPATQPKPAAPATDAEAGADEVASTQPRLSNKTFGRDPFKALIVEPVAAVAAAAPTGDTAAPTTTTDISIAPGATTGSTDSGTSTPAQSTAHSFKVVEVAPDNSKITVKVDGEVYRNLRAGEVFATYFKVILISGQVNAFQYGDEKFNVIGTKKLTIA